MTIGKPLSLRSSWGFIVSPAIKLSIALLCFCSIIQYKKMMSSNHKMTTKVNERTISNNKPGPEKNNVNRDPRVHYSILTLEWALRSHPERRRNVERIEREFPQFVRDIAIDASTEYEEINRILRRHNVTCDEKNDMVAGNLGLWASTLRRWEMLIAESDEWDFAVIVQDDHIYDEQLDARVTEMVRNRWKYFPGENSLPMYSFGHGDGVNLYTVSALPRLIAAFRDNFPERKTYALDYFFDSLGLASENMNFAWSKILDTHTNSTIGGVGDRKNNGTTIKCLPNGRLGPVAE